MAYRLPQKSIDNTVTSEKTGHVTQFYKDLGRVDGHVVQDVTGASIHTVRNRLL